MSGSYFNGMKFHAALLVAMLATPVLADEQDSQIRDGLDLFGEGARLILEGLRDEMAPVLEEVRPFLEEEMLPFLEQLGSLIDDITVYELPERLPNGDIIIRRSPDAPPWEPIEDGEGIDL